jgi:myo-inositol-1(or 4)-monophosphatase
MAERAARAGGTVARQAFRGDLQVDTKADKTDPVTGADRDAQRQVVATIRAEFPDDAVVGEEDAVPVGTDASEQLVDRVPETGDAWVVDPIDGTANFARGLRLWTTSVAAVVDGEAVAAVSYLPAHGELYAAGGEGATRDGDALAVSDRADPETFVVGLTGRCHPEDTGTFGDTCGALLDRLGDLRRLGSMQATLAFVASGGLEAVVATEEQSPWDTLAGVHLVREAGGVVTDLEGDRWAVDSGGLVASNGRAHDAVLAAVRAGLDG